MVLVYFQVLFNMSFSFSYHHLFQYLLTQTVPLLFPFSCFLFSLQTFFFGVLFAELLPSNTSSTSLLLMASRSLSRAQLSLIHSQAATTHANTRAHSVTVKPESPSLFSHRIMKSAWSMCCPHLLCLRMPLLPITAHFFRGNGRGLSWGDKFVC